MVAVNGTNVMLCLGPTVDEVAVLEVKSGEVITDTEHRFRNHIDCHICSPDLAVIQQEEEELNEYYVKSRYYNPYWRMLP